MMQARLIFLEADDVTTILFHSLIDEFLFLFHEATTDDMDILGAKSVLSVYGRTTEANAQGKIEVVMVFPYIS
jgi:hypothetical protein